MMQRLMLVLLAATAQVSPATAADSGRKGAQEITPYDAIWGAAADPARGISGTFRLTIKAFGVVEGIVYLNSEDDYRDQRNVSVDLLPPAQSEMARRFGTPDALVGKTITVVGTAKRTKIWFFANGQRTSKYYYQTHIGVRSAKQIEIVNDDVDVIS